MMEKILLSLVNDITIPLQDKKQILEYIEYHEYGIAFEILCSTIQQENTKISKEHYKKIEQYMELDDQYWENINIERIK